MKLRDKETCTGCGLCVNVCPNGCIKMKRDQEGFYFPVIHQQQCLDCGLCKKACFDMASNPKKEVRVYTIEVDIRPEDIKMDVYRASGAGGQHINKTSSAVRLTHIPTGIVTSCQTQRSQFQNRDYAMKMLKAELIKIKEREHLEKIEDIKGVQKEIAWGAQIRSYVFMPYTLVKDHRTGFENSNVNAVMDGDLDGFINAYLKALSLGEIEK